MTYLIDGVLIGSPSLVAKIVVFKHASGEQTRSGFDNVGPYILFGE